jgi:predicted nucleic acid-binding protein
VIVLDTTVLVYAVGGAHALRDPAQRLLAAAADGSLRATTTPEAIQEFAHIRARRRDRADAAALAGSYADLLSPLLQVGEADLREGLRVFRSTPSLGMFDAVLAAVALRVGARALVSADSDFSDVRGLTVLDLEGLDVASLEHA